MRISAYQIRPSVPSEPCLGSPGVARRENSLWLPWCFGTIRPNHRILGAPSLSHLVAEQAGERKASALTALAQGTAGRASYLLASGAPKREGTSGLTPGQSSSTRWKEEVGAITGKSSTTAGRSSSMSVILSVRPRMMISGIALMIQPEGWRCRTEDESCARTTSIGLKISRTSHRTV